MEFLDKIRDSDLGVQPQKFRKHDFKIAAGPKRLPSEPTFWMGLEAPEY